MANHSYINFDLSIQRYGEQYQAHVLQSCSGEGQVEFALPFSALELENFSLKIGHARGGIGRKVRGSDSPELAAAKEFGARLFNAIFQGDVYACLRASLDEASAQGQGVRLLLRLPPELVNLPWEYLYNPAWNQFFSLSTHTPLIRYFELSPEVRPLALKPPLRVLVVISSPNDYQALDVEREWLNLQTALQPLVARGLVEIDRLSTPSLLELQHQLRRREYHIFHFVGHGTFDERDQDGLLLFTDEQGRGRPLSGQYLGTLLRDHSSLRLAVLNACEGARTGSEDQFAGAAHSLVQMGLPAVIAMQFEISDDAAILFAQEFYTALADGYPLDAALTDARKAIFAGGESAEWGTPVLFSRVTDSRIFDLDLTSPTAQPAAEPAVPPLPAVTAAPSRSEGASRAAARPAGGSAWLRRYGLWALLVLIIGVGGIALLASGLGQASRGLDATPLATLAGGVATASPAPVKPSAAAPKTPAATRAGTQASSGLPVAVKTAVPMPAAAISPENAKQLTEYARWQTHALRPLFDDLVVSPDGSQFVIVSAESWVLYNTATFSVVRAVEGNTSAPRAAFSPDGRTLAIASCYEDYIRGLVSYPISLWRVPEGTLLAKWAQPDPVNQLVFSPDGKSLAAALDKARIKLFRVADGEVTRILQDYGERVSGVAFSPDGRTLASTSYTPRDTIGDQADNVAVRLWTAVDGKLIYSFVDFHTSAVGNVTFSPDGRSLASGAADRYARLWDAINPQPLLSFIEQGGVNGVDFSPDGKILATSSSGGVRLWRVADGEGLYTLNVAPRSVRFMSFVNKFFLLVALDDGTIQLWGVR